MDVSRDAQLASIDSSFAAAHAAHELSTLRHPTKPRLRAVATYEVLPDADVWANAYDLFRFSERPGERGPEVRVFPLHSFLLLGLILLGNFFFLVLFWVAGRPQAGLRDYAADGIGWRPFPHILPHQGR